MGGLAFLADQAVVRGKARIVPKLRGGKAQRDGRRRPGVAGQSVVVLSHALHIAAAVRPGQLEGHVAELGVPIPDDLAEQRECAFLFLALRLLNDNSSGTDSSQTADSATDIQTDSQAAQSALSSLKALMQKDATQSVIAQVQTQSESFSTYA